MFQSISSFFFYFELTSTSILQWYVFLIKISPWWKSSYVPVFSLNDSLLEAKSESRIKSLGRTTITKRQRRRSFLMIWELLSLDYFYGRFNGTTERQVNLKLRNLLHAWPIYRFYVKLLQCGLLLTLAWSCN